MAIQSLPQSGFLSDASSEMKRVLELLSSDVQLETGQVLFEQGDEGDALYAIISGALEFSVVSRDGRKLSLDVMHAGALFGEIALFDPGVRTATATALEPSVLCRVRNADILSGVQKTPELATDLILLAGQRMRWMNSQLRDQVFLPVPTRLARKVLYLTQNAQTPTPVLALSQSDLAEFVGATREAISKTLSGWKRLGVIEQSRGGLEVLDRAALQRLAEFDEV